MTRFNVTLEDPDAILGELLERIDNTRETRVGDKSGAPKKTPPTEVRELIAILKARTPPFYLDLIAHADHGVLQLGTWSITANDTCFEQIRDALPKDAIEGVRIIGCYTADTTPGQQAMLRVKAVLGDDVPVRGSPDWIYASNFDSGGFNGGNGLLVEAKELGMPHDLRAEAISQSFEKVPHAMGIGGMADLLSQLLPETRSEIASTRARWGIDVFDEHRPQLQELLHHVDPDPRVAPGLLARPDGELLYPVSAGSTEFYRVTSLFGGRVVRVYTRMHPSGVLLRYGGMQFV